LPTDLIAHRNGCGRIRLLGEVSTSSWPIVQQQQVFT
jgi:hypothetical protein